MNMKKIISALFTLTTFLGILTHTSNASDIYTYTVINEEAKTAEITAVSAPVPEDIEIPSQLNGYKIISVGNSVFQNCTELKNITIPEGITSLGEMIFSGCSNLENVTLPDSITHIGSYAFEGCSKIAEIDLSDSLTTINNMTFFDCSGLRSITIPDNVTVIEDSAFLYCTNLNEINIPENITRIENKAFDETAYVNNSSNWIDNTLYIDDCILKYNGTDSNYVVKDGIKLIADRAFSNCTTLIEIEIPDSVNYIGLGAFRDCSNLKTITSPFIGHSRTEDSFLKYLFGAEELTDSDVIPDSLENITITDTKDIYHSAFRQCYKLKRINISDSTTYIPGSVFSSCTALEELTIPFIGNSSDSEHNLCTLFHTLYKPLNLKKVVITNATQIPENAFNEIFSIEEIYINDSVKEIKAGAFTNCENLIKLVLPTENIIVDESNIFSGSHNVTVYGIQGSEIHKQTAKYGIPFLTLDGKEVPLPEKYNLIDAIAAVYDNKINLSLIFRTEIKSRFIPVAFYDGDDRLCNVEFVSTDNNAENANLLFDDIPKAEYIKIFLMKSKESLKPLHVPESIYIKR